MYKLEDTFHSFQDPILKEGKGLVYIERFLGLMTVVLAFLNSVTPIRFILCDLHYSHPLNVCESS